MDILYDINGKTIGKVGGILLNSNVEDRKELVEAIVNGIEKIKEDHINYLIMEELSLFNRAEIELIEDKTNLKILDGKPALMNTLPLVLKDIQSITKEKLREKEVLIIGNGDKLIEELICTLHKEISFITLVGDDEVAIENTSQSVFKRTGLSIFCSRNIDKILTNYSIIVNLKDDNPININRLRRGAIIFDFSINKGFSKNIKNRRGLVVIEDFMFASKDLNIMENQWVDGLISSKFYEFFYDHIERKPMGLLVNDNIYAVEDLIDKEIRKKGKL